MLRQALRWVLFRRGPATSAQRARHSIGDGSLMFIVFTTVADVPTSGSVLYSVTAWSLDGENGYQVGSKFQNGKEIANFAFSLTIFKQENVTNGAVAADKQIGTRYPISMLMG